jgi:hypothetical protein
MTGRSLLVAAVLLAGTAAGVLARETGDGTAAPLHRYAVGVSAGIPQTLAVTGERVLVPPLRIQANVGTVIAATSANARLLAVAEPWTVQPYMFLGGGGGYIMPLDGEHGFTGYTWWGFGLRLRMGRGRLFLEAGQIAGLNRDNGYERAYPAYATGMLVTL